MRQRAHLHYSTFPPKSIHLPPPHNAHPYPKGKTKAKRRGGFIKQGRDHIKNTFHSSVHSPLAYAKEENKLSSQSNLPPGLRYHAHKNSMLAGHDPMTRNRGTSARRAKVRKHTHQRPEEVASRHKKKKIKK